MYRSTLGIGDYQIPNNTRSKRKKAADDSAAFLNVAER